MKLLAHWPLYLIGRMLPAGVGFCGIALYTRALDPGSFGIYALLLSTSILIGMIGYTWLRVAVLRTMTSIEPHAESDFAATVAVAFVSTSVVVAVATVEAIRIFYPAIPLGTQLLTAAAATASGWFELNVTVAQARMRVTSYGILQAARALTALACSLGLIAFGFKANALLGGFTLGNCVAFGLFRTWRPALRGRFRAAQLAELFRFGWPSSAAALTYFSITFQRFVLAGAAGSAAVGVYAAATDFSQQTVGLLMGTVLIAGQPLAFRARDRGLSGELTRQLRSNARLLFAVGLGSGAALIAMSNPFAHLYFGAKFQTDAGLLLAISAATIFMSAFRGNYFEQAFEIARNTRPLAVIATFRTALTVVLSVLFIGRWGAVGAAVATLVAELFGLALSMFWSGRLIHVPVPIQSFLKIAAATGAMAIVMTFFPTRPDVQGFATTIAAGLAAYTCVFTLVHRRELARLLGDYSPLSRWLTRT